MKSTEMDMDIQTVKTYMPVEWTIFLCHITNWSGNGQEMRVNKIRKQTTELTNINECKSFLPLTVRCSVIYSCYIHLPLQSTPTWLIDFYLHAYKNMSFPCLLIRVNKGNINCVAGLKGNKAVKGVEVILPGYQISICFRVWILTSPTNQLGDGIIGFLRWIFLASP